MYGRQPWILKKYIINKTPRNIKIYYWSSISYHALQDNICFSVFILINNSRTINQKDSLCECYVLPHFSLPRNWRNFANLLIKRYSKHARWNKLHRTIAKNQFKSRKKCERVAYILCTQSIDNWRLPNIWISNKSDRYSLLVTFKTGELS